MKITRAPGKDGRKPKIPVVYELQGGVWVRQHTKGVGTYVVL